MRLNTRWLSIFGAQLYTATLAFINQLRPGCLWLYSPQSASSAGWTATHFVVLYALVKLAKDYVHYNHRGFSTALVSPERRHGEEYSRPRIHLHFSQHGVNTAHVLKPFTLMGPVHAISIDQPSANRHSSCNFIVLVSIHLNCRGMECFPRMVQQVDECAGTCDYSCARGWALQQPVMPCAC